MESISVEDKDCIQRNIKHLKDSILTDSELRYANMLEEEMGSEKVLIAEKVYNSLVSSGALFVSYGRTLEFTNSLLDIEGLLDRYLNLRSSLRKLLWLRIAHYPDIINGFILSLNKSNISEIDSISEHFDRRSAENVYSSLSEDKRESIINSITPEFYSISENFAKTIQEGGLAQRFIFISALLLRLEYDDSLLIEAMNRWIKEKSNLNLTDFVMLLKNWNEMKDYPLEWSISIVNKDQNC